ncbi:aminopeptidase P family protein [Candidatus Woesearchaeota archaeon]|nr:aminopeptidase P family protein [Candidatus Woesearchaeota archaeon]
MATKLIIAATTDADMRYAAGLSVPDPFILVDTGKKTLILSSLEYGRAKKLLGRKKGYSIVLLDPLYQEVKQRIRKKKGQKIRKGTVLAKIAALYLKKKRITKVVVSGKMWVAHVAQLKKLGIKVVISEKPLYDRSVKFKKEIAEIKKVRNATVKAMRCCVGIIKRSKNKRGVLVFKGGRLTSEFLRMEARKILLEHACEAQELIVSHGPQTAFPHDMGSGVIKTDEQVIMDFFPRSLETGYWFDMTRTVCKKPSPELQKLYNTVKRAQNAALKKVKAGVRTGVVHKAAADVFIKAGYKTTEEEGYIHSTGHGVGLEIHEAPSFHDGGTERLKKGMVVTVEPGLYYKKLGGVRLENTVVVTTTGYNDLTRMGRVLR